MRLALSLLSQDSLVRNVHKLQRLSNQKDYFPSHEGSYPELAKYATFP